MPRLILAGIPRSLAQTHAAFSPKFEAWDPAIIIPSLYDDPILGSCWQEVLARANETDHGGAHIIAVRKRGQEHRQDFEMDVHTKHRLSWLEVARVYEMYGTVEFTERILAPIIDFEEKWRAAIRPDIEDPLLLPDVLFKAKGQPGEIWVRAQNVRIGLDNLDEIAKFLGHFRNRYYKGYGTWVDDEGTRYIRDLSRHHGFHTPAERCWRFTFDVSEGVNFDVTKKHEKAHRNIDCHGFVI